LKLVACAKLSYVLIVSKDTKKSGKKKETKEKKTAGGAEAGKVPYHVTEKSKTTSEQSAAASAQLAEFGEKVFIEIRPVVISANSFFILGLISSSFLTKYARLGMMFFMYICDKNEL
jgi:hypothetical protein